jgi:hypothetical protein
VRPVGVAKRSPLQQCRYTIKRLGRRQAVEVTGIDHHPVADIGLVCDDEACGVGISRHDHRSDRQVVLARKIQIALVARRAAENRSGAVIHQHEIGDIDRDRPIGIERVDHIHRRPVANLLGSFERCQ